jgi:hypothetical protein
VYSRVDTIGGAKKLFLISTMSGKEHFFISKEKSDFARMQKVLDYDT